MRRFWPGMVYGLLLFVLVGAHAAMLIHWIEIDGTVADMVCCDMALPVSEYVQAEAKGELARAWKEPRPAWLGLLAVAGRHLFGPSPDMLLWVTLVILVATQLLLFLLGHRLGGPLAGVFAAGLFPLYPDVALMSRKWAPMVPHFFVLTLCALLVVRSRSFTRVIPSLGYVAAVAVGSLISRSRTDTMLFVAGAGSIAVGATARGLLLGRGPFPEDRVARGKVLLGALAVAGLTLYLLHHTLEPWVRASYYKQEMGLSTYEQHFPKWHWRALTAYLANLTWSSIGMILGIPFVAGMVLYLRRGPARAELFGWFLIPLVALSLIGKKNPYYASVIYPAIPVITAVGLASLPWRWIRYPAFGAVVLLAGLQWVNRSFPSEDRPLARRFRHYPQAPYTRSIFQMPLVPDLKPRGTLHHAWESRLLTHHLTATGCPRTRTLAILNTDDYQDIRLVLTLLDPCLEVKRWPEVGELSRADFVLSVEWLYPPGSTPPDATEVAGLPCDPVHMPWGGQVQALIEGEGFDQLELDRSDQRCMRLLRRRTGGAAE